MNCNTTHYRANSSSVPGDPTGRIKKETTGTLRAVWALHVTGGFSEDDEKAALSHADAHVRAWAVRLVLEDREQANRHVAGLAAMAQKDESPVVRLEIAAGLQRLPVDQRWSIAEALAAHEADSGDAHLPLMIWYGIEPAVAADKDKALALAKSAKIPLLRQFIAKRIAATTAKPQPAKQ